MNFSDRRRMMIFEPPRHGKSEYTSRKLPAWYLGNHPDHRVMLASYGASLATQHSAAVRNLIREHGERYFGISVSDNSSAKHCWSIDGHEGGMFALGVGGSATGFGANLLIIDDPIKNAEEALSPVHRQGVWEWWDSTASTRLEPEATVIIMNTRWHAEDLCGMLLEREGDKWDVLSLPAIAEENDQLGRQPGDALWPERYPIQVLREIERDKTPYWWGALYQQHPGLYGEDSWPREYFDCIYTDEWPAEFECSAMAVDAAMGKDKKKGDYSAIAFVGLHKGIVYADAWMGRVPPTQLMDSMIAMWVKHRPHVLGCESNGFQQLLIGNWRNAADAAGLLGVDCVEINNSGDKVLRIETALTPLLSRKMFRVATTTHNRRMVSQMKAIPHGDHDDGPDAVAMAVRLMQQYGYGRKSRDSFGSSVFQRMVN